MEQAEKAFHQRIYQGFQELALQNPHRLQRVAATGAVDQIAQQIWQLVQHHLPVLRS
jgi:dTMP kinase